MRTHLAGFHLILVCAYLVVSAATYAAAQSGSTTLAYQARVNAMITQRIAPALARNFELLRRGGGAVKLTYRVRASGDVESVKVTSSNSNRFVIDTCIRTIKAAKLPPIPKSVLKEQGHNWVDIATEISVGR